MNFGLASGPNEWYTVSELMVNFASILINNKTCDLDEIHNPSEDIPSDPKYLDKQIKLEQSKPAIFDHDEKDNHIDG